MALSSFAFAARRRQSKSLGRSSSAFSVAKKRWHNAHSRSLRFEPLEDRRLLSLSVATPFNQVFVDPATRAVTTVAANGSAAPAETQVLANSQTAGGNNAGQAATTFDHLFVDPTTHALTTVAPQGLAAPAETQVNGQPPFTPAQIQKAYGIDQLQSSGWTGAGETIVLLDAYDNPSIVSSVNPNGTPNTAFTGSDLDKFDQQYGLPAPPVFLKVNQLGDPTPANLPSADSGWAVEEALDVEWAHAIAPGASIVLVEANSAYTSDLIQTAVPTAANVVALVSSSTSGAVTLPPVAAVSMSFGGSEDVSETSLDSVFATPAGKPGITFLASTGDSGAPGGYPAYSPNVVAVGGTSLYLNSDNSYNYETAWSAGGGGQSTVEPEPAYQAGVQQSGSRQIPDVSFVADPNTGVWIYDAYQIGGWSDVGGTSLSSPCWAGLVAIADQHRVSLGKPALDGPSQTLPYLYAMPSADFHDITSGNNGYPAGVGYDMATGIGSPVANSLMLDLANPPPVAVNVLPLSATEGIALTATVVHISDFTATPSLTNCTATIDWGDGTPDSTIPGPDGHLVADPIAGYDVVASHVYANPGAYTVSVDVYDTALSQYFTGTGTTHVQDAALTAVASYVPPRVVKNQPFSDQKLFTFTDANPSPNIADYTATIVWGDGSVAKVTGARTAAGQIVTDPSGGFDVLGSHEYGKSDTYRVEVRVADADGSVVYSTSWSAGTSLPVATDYLATAVGVDGRIYAIGGWNSSLNVLNSVEVYDPGTNTWSLGPSLLAPRFLEAAATGPDGRIYVFGGSDVGGNWPMGILNSAEMIDPIANTSSPIAPMPVGLCEEGAVEDGGLIYLVGGIDWDGNIVGNTYVYDPAHNAYTALSPMPTARSWEGLVTGKDGRIYAMGGYDYGGHYLSTLEVYDPSTNAWTTAAPMPTARVGLQAVLGPDGLIYAIGGFDSAQQPVSTVDVYNPNTNTWISGPSLPTARGVGAAVGTDGQFYAIGGSTDGFWAQSAEVDVWAGMPLTVSQPLPSPLVVTTADDTLDVTYDLTHLSLRDAIAYANANPGGDTITFAPSLADQTITLTHAELDITDTTGTTTITGLGADELTVSGDNLSRVFEIGSGAIADISGLTITGGYASDGSDGVFTYNGVSYKGAGGIDNAGTLTVDACTISGNTASGSDTDTLVFVGGGVANSGTLTMSGSTVTDNSADYGGGGIGNVGTLRLINDTISGAKAVINSGDLPAVKPNSALYGAGVGTMAGGTTSILDCTIAGNAAANAGGGLYNDDATGAVTSLSNTIVAGNRGGNVVGTVTANYCLILNVGDATLSPASSHITDADPLLGPLADNWGPTETMALSPDSPAIGAGNNALAVDANGNPLASDQRGAPFVRIWPSPSDGGKVDLGAFELQPMPTITIITSDHPGGSVYGQAVTFTAIVSADLGSATPTGSVQFAIDGSNYGSSVLLVNGIASMSVSSLSAGTHSIVATYTDTVNVPPAFQTSTGTLSFHVSPASLIITTLNKWMLQGTNPATLSFAVSYTGFLNGDTAASLTAPPNITTTATSSSPAGTYPITASGAVDPNYVIIYQNTGVLTVDPTVNAGYLMPDPSNTTSPAQSILYVWGTAGTDSILINSAGSSKSVLVIVNGVSHGTFGSTSQPISRIVVHGVAGTDSITVSPSVTLPTWLYLDNGTGGIIHGGGGPTYEFGDPGATLYGGAGRSILIGGRGSQTLNAGIGDAILIGGTTAYSLSTPIDTSHDAALVAILNEWSSTSDYAARVGHITNGANGQSGAGGQNHDSSGNYFYLKRGTVYNDFAADRLLGNTAAMDLFFRSIGDTVSGQKSGETTILV